MRKLPEFVKYFLVAVVASVVTVGLYSYLFPKPFQSILDKQQQTTPVRLTRAAAVATETNGLDFTVPSAAALPTVVHINSSTERETAERPAPRQRAPQSPEEFFEFFGGPGQPQGPSESSGSGVILTNDGYIVTNNHVVEGATTVKVTLYDNRTFNAKVLGTDSQTDLALLKIEAKELPFLKMGNSDAVKVGQWVLAVGNPFNLTSTVTAGIVSAKGRGIGINGDQYSVESFIQTDAAVNPGNSGGALINLQGELVGINTAIASRTGSYSGYSFAIPAAIVTKVVDDLMNYGKVQRGLIGIEIVSVDQALADKEGLGTVQGVYVRNLTEDGAAKAAGLQKGDVIVAADGKPMLTSSELLGYIALKRPGDKVTVSLLRNKAPKTYTVTLRSTAGNTQLAKEEAPETAQLLGLSFGTPSAEELAKLNLSAGIKVEKVLPGPASRSGIRSGFIITHIQDDPVSTPQELSHVLTERMRAGKRGTYVEGRYPTGESAVYAFELPASTEE
jgi:serine protease Do